MQRYIFVYRHEKNKKKMLCFERVSGRAARKEVTKKQHETGERKRPSFPSSEVSFAICFACQCGLGGWLWVREQTRKADSCKKKSISLLWLLQQQQQRGRSRRGRRRIRRNPVHDVQNIQRTRLWVGHRGKGSVLVFFSARRKTNAAFKTDRPTKNCA